MIGWLQGVLRHKQAPELIVDVQGLGYEVWVPMTVFYTLPEVGQSVALYIHMVVREDAQVLYGFLSIADRAVFRSLIKVNGVGPKLALSVLSAMTVAELVAAIGLADVCALVKIPGVGKKTAERLLVEMQDRLANLPHCEPSTSAAQASGLPALSQARSEAESALIALGYKAAQAKQAVNAQYQPGISSDDLIRLALKSMI